MSQPNRPSNTKEIQRKLAAGDKFKQISGSGNIFQLHRIDGPLAVPAFQLSINGRKMQLSIHFICASCIHKVERAGVLSADLECYDKNLFFVEIEFID
jgi:hypothetical protein